MRYKEISLVKSEIGTIEEILSRMSKDRVIERMTYESSLEDAKKRLQELQVTPQLKSLPLTFRGGPVDRMFSIDASFGLSALKLFIETIDATLKGLLKNIPRKDRKNLSTQEGLRIADVAQGSFGFELELPPSDPQQLILTDPGHTIYEKAIKSTISLLHAASTGDEEAISDLIAEVRPKAAKKALKFAELLKESGAQFSSEFEGKRVHTEGEDDIRRIVSSLEEKNISEEEDIFEGIIQGILPEYRDFEAMLFEQGGKQIRGKIDQDIEDIYEFKKTWEGKPCMLELLVITANGRSRYRLLGAESRNT